MSALQGIPGHPRTQDLTGRKFGRLTVIEFAGKNANGRVKWLCACECGTVKEFLAMDLRKKGPGKGTKSCGCLASETARALLISHGQSHTPEYEIWHGMKQRCLNPNSESYPRYGALGVKVCQAWIDSFEAFIKDMGPRPSLLYSLDRFPNRDGDYCLENCRWATRSEQQRNRRDSQWITYQGETLHLTDWAVRLGIHKSTLATRLVQGWTVERAFTQLVRPVGQD